MMTKAIDALDSVEPKDREVSSVCVPVSEKTMHKIKSMIQEYRQQILNLANEDRDADRVYQLNFQFFPLSKKVED
jgi:uncharacterized protein (TIGR02147 family)